MKDPIQLSNGKWYISYYVGPKQKRVSGPNKKELIAAAEEERRNYRLNKNQPELVKQSTTFADACTKYIHQYAIPNNQEQDKYQTHYFVSFFEKLLGNDIKISNITVENLKDLKTKMLQDFAPSTVIRRWTLLNSIFRESLVNGYVTSNPCKQISNKALRKQASRRNTSRFRWFTDEETQKIYSELLKAPEATLYANTEHNYMTPERREENMLYAQVARNTGLRPDSINRLEWFDINFDANQFTARETKNGQTYIMPMNKAAKSAFMRLWEMKGQPISGHVFREANWSRIFTRLFRNLGWNDSHLPKEQQKVSERNQAVLYSFRHTFASHLVMAGFAGKPLWDLMGWENGTEEATYAHLTPKFKANMANAVSLEYVPMLEVI